MEKYIIGIDQSTQGTKVILFDGKGRMVLRLDKAHRQIINEKGWVEHDPQEIWQNLLELIHDLLKQSRLDPAAIAGIGISNQRETAVAWDRSSGKPVYNAVVWQCARGEELCSRIEAARPGIAQTVQKKTGLRFSPYFSAAKLGWIMEHVPGVYENALQGKICCGTMDSYLVFRMTRGRSFLMDYSNASRTQLFDIFRLCWDRELCELFGIPVVCMPDLSDSDGFFGCTDFDGVLPHAVPIHSAMGDSHAALFGQGCLERGMVKATYGTGSSIMMNIGSTPVLSGSGLVTSLAWRIGGQVSYVLEGNINYTGAAISWLKDDLKLIGSAGETESMARAANPADQTILVPAFTGLGAPYWDSSARAAFIGMSRTTGRNELARAALDCIAYQIAEIVELMSHETSIGSVELRADGGPTRNGYLMQLQADLIGGAVRVPEAEELSCIGAAWAAGLSLGLYDQSLFSSVRAHILQPQISPNDRAGRMAAWKSAVARVRG